MRGAPHNGLAILISRIRVRISKGAFGRPAVDLDFQRQNARNPRRCQPITVSDLTIDRAFRVPGDRRYNHTKSSRSVLSKTSRSGLFRPKTLSWWRSAAISVCRSARDRKKFASVPQISLRMSTMPQNIAQHRPIGESDSICGRHKYLDLPQLRDDLLSSQSLLRHLLSPFR